MHFEVSERIRTTHAPSQVWQVAIQQLSKVSLRVEHQQDGVVAHDIEATFGSINRTDFAKVRVLPRDGGVLLTAEITYRPSVAFWIFMVIGLFTGFVWCAIPLGFYLYQKNTVRQAIELSFKRVRDETESFGTMLAPPVAVGA